MGRSQSRFDPQGLDIPGPATAPLCANEIRMTDLIYIGIGVVTLLVFALYALGLKRI